MRDTIKRIPSLNAHIHIDDRDCEVVYYRVPVMSERHAWRIASALGWGDWSQGQGGRFGSLHYDAYKKAVCYTVGWDI